LEKKNMTKSILMTAVALATALHAQNSFQSSTWLGAMPPNNPQQALRPDGQMGPVIGKPFSGVETRETRQVLSDGTPINKKTVSKIFRDAEGRMRSDGGTHAMLFDAPNLASYTINPKNCSKQTVREGSTIMIAATESGTSWSSQTKSGTPSKPNPGTVIEDLGFQVINGISVKGMRQTLTIPAKTLGSDHDVKVVNERWYSDALGILIKSSNVDPRFGSTTYELSEINQSTPDPALFTPPTGCSEFQMPGMHR